MAPRTIVITGANSGMGLETLKALAAKGHHVVAACRDKPESRSIVDGVNELPEVKDSGGTATFMDLDLSNLASCRTFAQRFKADVGRLDTLVCNAGIMNTPYRLTKDGFESQFQTKFLGHFLLSLELLPLLRESDDPRLIHVCSASAEKGTVHAIADLEAVARVGEADYNAMTSYRESKLAQQATTLTLARLSENSGVRVAVIHPGVVNTNLFYRDHGAWYQWVMAPFAWLGYASGFLKTPAQGADTAIYLCEVADGFESGKYWADRKPVEPNPISLDQEYGKQLVEWSVKMCS
ncbi:short-chain dehydrogenase/reductase SDR [Hyaloraphidium curvatum]|nr:short-chain dehydrogenase/reductase SDR [Hyaloraphidium curvatum]